MASVVEGLGEPHEGDGLGTVAERIVALARDGERDRIVPRALDEEAVVGEQLAEPGDRRGEPGSGSVAPPSTIGVETSVLRLSPGSL